MQGWIGLNRLLKSAAVIYFDLLYALMRLPSNSICGMVLYLFLVRMGFRTAPFFSIITGEITLSVILGYVIILPTPIGIEALEFPTRILADTLNKSDRQLKNS